MPLFSKFFCWVQLLFFRWLSVDRRGKGLLIKDGPGAMARDGFVGGLLAAIPEQKIKFHGGDRMPGCVECSL